MLANKVDMLAGTRGHRYFVERQLKCLNRNDYLFRVHFVKSRLNIDVMQFGGCFKIETTYVIAW